MVERCKSDLQDAGGFLRIAPYDTDGRPMGHPATLSPGCPEHYAAAANMLCMDCMSMTAMMPPIVETTGMLPGLRAARASTA